MKDSPRIFHAHDISWRNTHSHLNSCCMTFPSESCRYLIMWLIDHLDLDNSERLIHEIFTVIIVISHLCIPTWLKRQIKPCLYKTNKSKILCTDRLSVCVVRSLHCAAVALIPNSQQPCCMCPCKSLNAADVKRWLCWEEQSVGSLYHIIHAPVNVCMRSLPRRCFRWLSKCNPLSSC